MKKINKGFTLIELLVVIAIIAMLLSIILPGLKLAKEAGRRITCGAHMHQLGLAISMYAGENKGFVPLHDSEQPRANGLYWTSYMYTGKITNLGFLVGDYIPTGSKIIFCPSNRVLLGRGTASGFDQYMPANGWWEVWEHIQDHGDWPYLPTSSDYRNLYMDKIDGKLERAGNKAIVADWFTNVRKQSPSATWAPQGILEHHQKGYTVLYTDGSAKFVKDSENYVFDLGVLWDKNDESASEAWRFFDTH